MSNIKHPKRKDWLNTFVEKNIWGIFIVIFSMIVFYGTITADVRANAKEIDDIDSTVMELQELFSRVVVLEEREKQLEEDVSEIKVDVKELLRRY